MYIQNKKQKIHRWQQQSIVAWDAKTVNQQNNEHHHQQQQQPAGRRGRGVVEQIKEVKTKQTVASME